MKILQFCTLAVMTISACKAYQPVSQVKSIENTGSIRVYAKKQANVYDLMVSVPDTADSVRICENENIDSCKKEVGTQSSTATPSNTGSARVELTGKGPASSPRRMLFAGKQISADKDYTAVFFAKGKPLEGRTFRLGASTNSGTATAGTKKSSGGSTGKSTAGQVVDGGDATTGKFKIITPQTLTPAMGLIVFLHGSTASSYDTFPQDMRELGEKTKSVIVSALAPNGQGWNEPPNPAEWGKYAQGLNQLLQKQILTAYDIDHSRIYFIGQSSGSGFLVSDYLPRYAAQYGGGAILLCGGQELSVPIEADVSKNKFRIHYLITSDDFWKFRQGEGCFREKKIPVTVFNNFPGGHCSFMGAGVPTDRTGPPMPLKLYLEQLMARWEKGEPGFDNDNKAEQPQCRSSGQVGPFKP